MTTGDVPDLDSGRVCHPGRDVTRRSNRLALIRAIGITFCFVLIEAVGGLLSGSLALLADAGHMVSDLAALCFAFFALRIAEREATSDKTYGYVRSEILAALANGIVLVLVSIYVMYEAFERFRNPPEIRSGLMLGVAIAGLVANLLSGAVLFRSRKDNLNIRGAFLHVVGDTLGSIGAIIAALCVKLLGWAYADPAVALGIALLILFSAWGLLKESIDILMESTPRHIDLGAVRDAICDVPGVGGIRDLHVWTLTSGYYAMSAHVSVVDQADAPEVLEVLTSRMRDSFDISHTTFQLECET